MSIPTEAIKAAAREAGISTYEARAALTAAAPHIQAATWDAALDFPAELPEIAWMNPTTGLIDYISVQGWLNAMADQLENGQS